MLMLGARGAGEGGGTIYAFATFRLGQTSLVHCV